MAKLIILGGANCQRSAFLMAKRLNIQTVLFDMRADAPACELADEYVNVSTFDVQNCLKEAKAIQADGIITLGTDQPVYTAAYVAHALSLPSLISPSTALAATNKALMKETLTRHRIPAVPYAVTKKDMLGDIRLQAPFVIKPLDNQGQKGVFRCESMHEVEALFEKTLSYSRCTSLLLEEYYKSKEVTVSAWVERGKAHILTVTDRITFEHGRHIGICSAHRYPSHAAKGNEKAIEDVIRRIPAAFSIFEGPLYVQLLIGENGVLVNELACRIGGAFEDIFIPHLTGFDILRAVIKSALGEKQDFNTPLLPAAHEVRVLMPYARAGKISAITPVEHIKRLPFVLDTAYNFRAGDTLPPFENAAARLKHAVLIAEDAEKMRQYIKQYQELLYVLDEEGKDMRIAAPDVL